MIDAIGSGSIIIDPSFIERRLRTHNKTSVSAHSLSSYRKGVLNFHALHSRNYMAFTMCYVLCLVVFFTLHLSTGLSHMLFLLVSGINGLKAAAEFMKSFEGTQEEEELGGLPDSRATDPAFVRRQVGESGGG